MGRPRTHFKEGDIIVESFKDQKTYYLILSVVDTSGMVVYKGKNLETNKELNFTFGSYDKVALVV